MDLLEYIGHFHPVLVHLPIGILLIAIGFKWLSYRRGFRKLRKSVRLLLLMGFLSATMSSLTGYLLSQSGDYDAELLKTHQWLGIGVTILSLVALLLSKQKQKELRLAYSFIIFSLAILVVLTGHAGGSLTHGADFLKPPPVSEWFDSGVESKLMAVDFKTALIYKDMVAPVLNAKCIRCHGPSRQKGKLRLDQPEFISKGGKDGLVIDTANWDESEIVRRIQLELSDDDHMPPREKKQLTSEEISLLLYWIKNGADFKTKLSTLPGADSVMQLLSDLEDKGPGNAEVKTIIPMPDPQTIDHLRAGGVAISFLADGNGYVSLNFVNADSTRLSLLLKELPRIHLQVVEVKFPGCDLKRLDWAQLSALTSLTRLNLEGSNITDNDMPAIQSLSGLQYLNLVGTSTTLAGLEKLKLLNGLTKIYLYHTKINEADGAALRQLFPKASIDFGNYKVPTLPSDTAIQKERYTVPKK